MLSESRVIIHVEIRDFLKSRDRYTNKELLAQIETEYWR